MVLARGGARNRSGPQPDPTSGRSDRRGLALTTLPREGYSGEVPEFPLMRRIVMRTEYGEKGNPFKVVDESATELFEDRELSLWEWAWTTPQAAAWSEESWRWQAVAHWVRTSAICESGDSTAADRGSLHRFADQIGMTPAGLRENGWSISADEVGRARESKPEASVEKSEPKRRLRSVPGDGS